MGGEQLPTCARVAAQVATVIPPRSESLVPARVIDPCGEASLCITEGQTHFTQSSLLLVAKTLVDITNGVVPQDCSTQQTNLKLFTETLLLRCANRWMEFLKPANGECGQTRHLLEQLIG